MVYVPVIHFDADLIMLTDCMCIFDAGGSVLKVKPVKCHADLLQSRSSAITACQPALKHN